MMLPSTPSGTSSVRGRATAGPPRDRNPPVEAKRKITPPTLTIPRKKPEPFVSEMILSDDESIGAYSASMMTRKVFGNGPSNSLANRTRDEMLLEMEQKARAYDLYTARNPPPVIDLEPDCSDFDGDYHSDNDPEMEAAEVLGNFK